MPEHRPGSRRTATFWSLSNAGVEREPAAWNAHDADGVAACYAEDAVLYDVGLPDTVQGRAAIRDSVAGYLAAFSDLHVDVRKPIVYGNRAAQEFKVTGTNDG